MRQLLASALAAGFVLAGSGLAVTAGAAPAAALASASQSNADAAKVAVITVGTVVEMKDGTDIFQLQDDAWTLRDYVLTIQKAKEDPEVRAILLQLDGPSYGAAQLSELRRALADFRASGKKIYASADFPGMGQYALLSVADEVVVPPCGGLEVYGMRADMMYFKDTLAKIGVTAQVVNTGKFKTAMEPFTHNEMSEGTIIQTSELMEDIFTEFAEGVAESRGMDLADAKRALTEGPYNAKQAIEAGLVDKAEYLPDAMAAWDEEAGKELEYDWEYSHKPPKKKEPLNLFTLFSGAAAKKKAEDKSPKIAVVFAQGAIADGRSEPNPFGGGGGGIFSEDFIETLDEIAEEENLKALVLRVDSPGGSANASDRIWRELERFQEDGVPVIVSMGNVAASGGYYISMGADRIFAEPTTITGSIGVVGGRFILGGLYEKVGLVQHTIAIGRNTGLQDPTRGWNKREREIVRTMIDDIYETFTSKVAEGRGMSQDRVKELGGGRVWSGVDALENGLVDELGGLGEAIAYAHEAADAPDANVVTFPKEKDFMEVFEELLSGGAEARIAASATANPGSEIIAALRLIVPKQQHATLSFLVDTLSEGKPVTLMLAPWTLTIE
ncbi:MAG: signal peptide peptidase SppA [Candidatus Sumerlaeia bacterium]|nr:signal peptide peptidase SppA [Candidatus Sumerlaeia bacterium]